MSDDMIRPVKDMRPLRITAWTLAAILALGCANVGGASPVEPGNDPTGVAGLVDSRAQSSWRNRYLWGLWEVLVSPDHLSAETVPMRALGMHLNVVRLLEVTPCSDCLKIGNLQVYPPNELTADLTLIHPFPGNLKLTGFDVRGILISEGDYTFPVSGRSIALGDGVMRMLNADGYTSLFNPTEFPETNPPALGYIPGKYATGGDLAATLNPFIAYRPDAPRCMFASGGVEAQTVRIRVPSGPLRFGYAVDASWKLVQEVTDPLTDFPPEANCLEAYRVAIQVKGELGSSVGSTVPISL